MKETAPPVVRIFLVLDRIFSAMWRTFKMVRDETLWAWASKSARDQANRAIYGGQTVYSPGGSTFQDGLFSWEREEIAASFPPSGRILLGGAGGGRELVELCKAGYDVLALEPVPALAAAARAAAAPYPRSKVITASYTDLVHAAEQRSGPLAAHLCGVDFQGVILGWTSFSYVWKDEREALLKALRRLAPHAPVLLSFFAREDVDDGRLAKLRDWYRRLLRRVGAKDLSEPGDIFHPSAGFHCSFTPEEIYSLAREAGYDADTVEGHFTPRTLLRPRSS